MLGAAALLLVLSISGMAKGIATPARIAKDGETATKEANKLGAEIVVTRVWWQSQVLAATAGSGKSLYLVPGYLWEFLDAAVERGHRQIILVSPDPLNMRLSKGFFAKTTTMIPGWLPLQLVSLQRPTADHRSMTRDNTSNTSTANHPHR
jgi:hypothetical protein